VTAAALTSAAFDSNSVQQEQRLRALVFFSCIFGHIDSIWQLYSIWQLQHLIATPIDDWSLSLTDAVL
jgi:hypothetical protein